MKTKVKIAFCYMIIAISILILVVGVDTLPHMACWTPLILSLYFTFRYKPFAKHINQKLDTLFPLD
jgi:hypothetical protein